MFEVKYAGLTDTGRVREKNEDAWTAVPEMGLFIVSDGMGGHFAGDLASRIVVEALPKLLKRQLAATDSVPRKERDDERIEQCITHAISELSMDLCAKAEDEPGLDGMGATVVLAFLRGTTAHIVHLGDSRAYVLRNRVLQQLTRDHSLVQLLIDNNEMQAEDAGTHPARGQLTRHVGMPGEPLPEAIALTLHAGDRLLLCSDGLTRMLEDAEVCVLLLDRERSQQAVCEQLVSAANRVGGEDNITVLLVDIMPPAEDKVDNSIANEGRAESVNHDELSQS